MPKSSIGGASNQNKIPLCVNKFAYDTVVPEPFDEIREHIEDVADMFQDMMENLNLMRIQHPDMMIAGVARSLDVPIVTSDDGFERIDDLDVENPRKMY